MTVNIGWAWYTQIRNGGAAPYMLKAPKSVSNPTPPTTQKGGCALDIRDINEGDLLLIGRTSRVAREARARASFGNGEWLIVAYEEPDREGGIRHTNALVGLCEVRGKVRGKGGANEPDRERARELFRAKRGGGRGQ